MRDYNAMITESKIKYTPESDTESVAGSLTNSDVAATRIPVQPEAEQDEETIINTRTSLSSLTSSFPYQTNTIIDDRLRELSLKYEIQQDLGERLRALEEYKIVIVCDDSGSMKTTVDSSTRTRWDELRDIVKMVLEIAILFDSSGIDIHFLNRPPVYNVNDHQSVDELFSKPPRGYTPLVAALTYLFQLPECQRGHDKKLLVFVATDGAPTDNKGNINVDELEHLMTHQRNAETTHVMFLICTDDPACVDYLNEWDKKMLNVDVTDDFKTERNKIRQCQGANYPFSKGDYIVKALVGAIDPFIDSLNDANEDNNQH